MINYIDKIRILAVMMVFFLHSFIFVGKDFPMSDIIKESSLCMIFFMPAWAGVWIFFVVSGYLAGIGFKTEKYKLTFWGVKEYFYKKIRRVYIPVILYICFCTVMLNPDFLDRWVVVRQFIFLTYRGIPGTNAMGATWFVFPLMLMYFTAPLLALLYKKFRKKTLAIMFVIVICGFVNRYLWYNIGGDWYEMYTSWLCNMDFFASGFGLAYLKDHLEWQKNKTIGYVFLMIFSGFVFLNCYIIAFQWNMGWYSWGFETIYLILTCIYLYIFRANRGKKYNLPKVERFAKWFSVISFEFYFFHSNIFDRLCSHIGGHTAIEQYVKFIIVTFIITCIFAYGWHKMTGIKSN